MSFSREELRKARAKHDECKVIQKEAREQVNECQSLYDSASTCLFFCPAYFKLRQCKQLLDAKTLELTACTKQLEKLIAPLKK